MKLTKNITVFTLSLSVLGLAQDIEMEQQDIDNNDIVEEYSEEAAADIDMVGVSDDAEPESTSRPLSFSLDLEEPDEPSNGEANEAIQPQISDREVSVPPSEKSVEIEEAQEKETQPVVDTVPVEQAVLVKVEIKKQITAAKDSASKYKLQSPWAPKPLQNPPAGWRYIPAHQSQAYPVTVVTGSGSAIDLKVIPYVLVPEDSLKIVQVCEPGYVPEHGYAQQQSVSARMQTTNKHLNEAVDAIQLSIDNLSALVDTLPK